MIANQHEPTRNRARVNISQYPKTMTPNQKKRDPEAYVFNQTMRLPSENSSQDNSRSDRMKCKLANSANIS